MPRLVNCTVAVQPTAEPNACTAVACRNCGLYQLGRLPGSKKADPTLLQRIACSRRQLRKGEYLYRLDEPVKAVYAIRFGSLKSYVLSGDGRLQITGFHIVGEPLGLNDLATGRHTSEAQALEPTSLCEVPLDHLEHLSVEVPSIRSQMLIILSREVQHYQELMLMLGKKNAEERLATFLLGLSHRFEQHGFSALRFNLSMSRGDIGTYLGVAEETVCRLFSRLQEEGLIRAHRRLVEILDLDRLSSLALR